MTATDDPVVLINIFKCDQRHLDELIERLAALAKVQSELPGFVSATLHRGLNGRQSRGVGQRHRLEGHDAPPPGRQRHGSDPGHRDLRASPL